MRLGWHTTIIVADDERCSTKRVLSPRQNGEKESQLLGVAVVTLVGLRMNLVVGSHEEEEVEDSTQLEMEGYSGIGGPEVCVKRPLILSIDHDLSMQLGGGYVCSGLGCECI